MLKFGSRSGNESSNRVGKYDMTENVKISAIYKVEDIFQDIEGDPDHVKMTIPEEVLREKGWGEGTRIKVEVGDQGTLIITEIKDEDGEE
jgi:hypothetical protein